MITAVFLENTGRSTKETLTVRIQQDSGNRTNVRIIFIYQQQQTEDTTGKDRTADLWTRQGLDRPAPAQLEMRIKPDRWVSISAVPRPWVQPTTDRAALTAALTERKCICKWACAVQICAAWGRRLAVAAAQPLSRAHLFAAPWTVAHRLLCPWTSKARH